MTWASCWLSSRSGVGDAALAVECPPEAFEQVGVAQALDGRDAAAAGIGDFVIGPSVFVREFQLDFANSAAPTRALQTATRNTSENCGLRP